MTCDGACNWHQGFEPIKVYPDGAEWCALQGANLHEGKAGFGSTPQEALVKLLEQIELPTLVSAQSPLSPDLGSKSITFTNTGHKTIMFGSAVLKPGETEKSLSGICDDH